MRLRELLLERTIGEIGNEVVPVIIGYCERFVEKQGKELIANVIRDRRVELGYDAVLDDVIQNKSFDKAEFDNYNLEKDWSPTYAAANKFAETPVEDVLPIKSGFSPVFAFTNGLGDALTKFVQEKLRQQYGDSINSRGMMFPTKNVRVWINHKGDPKARGRFYWNRYSAQGDGPAIEIVYDAGLVQDWLHSQIINHLTGDGILSDQIVDGILETFAHEYGHLMTAIAAPKHDDARRILPFKVKGKGGRAGWIDHMASTMHRLLYMSSLDEINAFAKGTATYICYAVNRTQIRHSSWTSIDPERWNENIDYALVSLRRYGFEQGAHTDDFLSRPQQPGIKPKLFDRVRKRFLKLVYQNLQSMKKPVQIDPENPRMTSLGTFKSIDQMAAR